MSDERTLMGALDGALDSIWDRVALHQRIDRCLSKVLPNALARHTRVSCVDSDSLILICDTPAWAADLRYRERQIVEIVNNWEDLRLARCRVLVRPDVFN